MEKQTVKIILYISVIGLVILLLVLAFLQPLLENAKPIETAPTSSNASSFIAKFFVDGEEYKTINIIDGYITELPIPPSKAGYVFDYWEVDNTKFEATKKLNSDVEINAIYKKIETGSIYTITYKYENGIDDKIVQVGEGVELKAPANPKKSGYKFIGWFENEEPFDFNTKISKDTTLVAKYEELPKTVRTPIYTVQFKYNGGGIDDIEYNVEQGHLLNEPPKPYKTGYKFIGWYSGDIKISFPYTITNNITLTAKYQLEN